MRTRSIAVGWLLAAMALAAVPAVSGAHPDEAGEVYVPWTDDFSQQQSVKMLRGQTPDGAAPAAAEPGAQGMELVGNADKDGTVNSDLAFWGQLAYAGNYDGFRILDVKGQQPRTVVDFKCRGPQNDVSVYELGRKRYLFQSIDSGQTAEDCSSTDAPIVGTTRTGYEGIRVFDVSNPAKPKFLDMIQTACGSHTHTLIPDGRDRAYIYVSSYPLGSGITAPTGPGDFKPCSPPHKKISIIEVSERRGEFRFRLKEQQLSEDTDFSNGFQACHDIQAFMEKDLAVSSCAGDGQLWDISDPWNPTSNVEGKHTHIRSPSPADRFEFIHSGVVSWDGKTFAIMDETGGGGTAECDGDASQDGFYYFYDVVKPGAPAPPLKARFTIPRAQTPEICVSHNANVIPVRGRNIMPASYYQGGNTVIDFTNPSKPREVAFSDLQDSTGLADSWSTYWYNGRLYANGGLNRRGTTGNRGVDVFELTGDADRATRGAKRWKYSNPQTQEEWQAPGGRDDDDDDDGDDDDD